MNIPSYQPRSSEALRSNQLGPNTQQPAGTGLTAAVAKAEGLVASLSKAQDREVAKRALQQIKNFQQSNVMCQGRSLDYMPDHVGFYHSVALMGGGIKALLVQDEDRSDLSEKFMDKVGLFISILATGHEGKVQLAHLLIDAAKPFIQPQEYVDNASRYFVDHMAPLFWTAAVHGGPKALNAAASYYLRKPVLSPVEYRAPSSYAKGIVYRALLQAQGSLLVPIGASAPLDTKAHAFPSPTPSQKSITSTSSLADIEESVARDPRRLNPERLSASQATMAVPGAGSVLSSGTTSGNTPPKCSTQQAAMSLTLLSLQQPSTSNARGASQSPTALGAIAASVPALPELPKDAPTPQANAQGPNLGLLLGLSPEASLLSTSSSNQAARSLSPESEVSEAPVKRRRLSATTQVLSVPVLEVGNDASVAATAVVTKPKEIMSATAFEWQRNGRTITSDFALMSALVCGPDAAAAGTLYSAKLGTLYIESAPLEIFKWATEEASANVDVNAPIALPINGWDIKCGPAQALSLLSDETLPVAASSQNITIDDYVLTATVSVLRRLLRIPSKAEDAPFTGAINGRMVVLDRANLSKILGPEARTVDAGVMVSLDLEGQEVRAPAAMVRALLRLPTQGSN